MPGKIAIPLIKPMLAVNSKPFDSEEYLFEVKWDGYRALAYLDSNYTELRSRNQLDISGLFPELQQIHKNVKRLPALLDGEVVVFMGGKPSFQALQSRGRLKDSLKIRGSMDKYPAYFLAFDILYVSGQPVMGEQLQGRKAMMKENVTADSRLIIPEFLVGEGLLFWEAVKGRGLEGAVAKALKSPYLPGKRSPYWKKIRHTKEADLVVCGYRVGKGGRRLGSLLLCACRDGKKVYLGKVGTGFTRDLEEDLLKKLGSLHVEKPPVAVPREESVGVVWVRPELVCAVEYLERTAEGYLRHPSFKGLRFDKDAAECSIPCY
ncbi:MAG: non-homologous end-joining DNA ligase [Bacillota bacterium]